MVWALIFKLTSLMCAVSRPKNQLRDELQRGLFVVGYRNPSQNNLGIKGECVGSCDQTKERDRSWLRVNWIQGQSVHTSSSHSLALLLYTCWPPCLLPSMSWMDDCDPVTAILGSVGYVLRLATWDSKSSPLLVTQSCLTLWPHGL